MSAQPVHDHDPRDPQAILAALPDRAKDEFLAEYHQAVDGAHEVVGGYGKLQEFLQLWWLRSVAYAKPDYWERLEDVREGRGTYHTLEEVVDRYNAAHAGT